MNRHFPQAFAFPGVLAWWQSRAGRRCGVHYGLSTSVRRLIAALGNDPGEPGMLGAQKGDDVGRGHHRAGHERAWGDDQPVAWVEPGESRVHQHAGALVIDLAERRARHHRKGHARPDDSLQGHDAAIGRARQSGAGVVEAAGSEQCGVNGALALDPAATLDRQDVEARLGCRRGEGRVDAGDERLGAGAGIHRRADVADGLAHFLHRGRDRHLDDADAARLQHVAGGGDAEGSDDHHVGVQGDHLLGGAAQGRQTGGLAGEERHAGATREGRQTDNALALDDAQQQLVGAEVQRGDAAGRAGLPRRRDADSHHDPGRGRQQTSKHLHLPLPALPSQVNAMFASVSPSRLALVKRLLGSAAVLAALASPAFAEDKTDADPLKITVTANRVPTAIARSGSSVTVIDRSEIERSGAVSVTDVLERVPGIDFSDNGGVGSATSVRIRGMDARHTLVLIDGVRVGDVSSTGGETNLGLIDLSMVDRIEVVRGPQSALYGSDAMGGVVNIITRSGKGQPRSIEGFAEGGSYNTRTGGVSVSGSRGPVGVAVGGSWFATEGYSRVKTSADRDQAKRVTGHGRLNFEASDWLSFDAGFHHWATRADFDNTFGINRDGPNTEESEVDLGRFTTRTRFLNGKFNSAFTVFAGRTERQSRTVSDFGPYNYGYTGDRVGFDLVNDINWGAAGITVFGGAAERTAYDFSDDFSRSKADESRRGVFVMHQLTLMDRLHLSAAGRVDAFGNYGTFPTWRVTAAYDIHETETRLRASAGTGAKAPSLYQRYGAWVGNTTLEAETSFGAELGVEQAFWNGRASASLTGFYNRYKNFIDYDFAASRYEQIGRARMFGIEASGRVDIIEGMLEGKATYTWLDTEDGSTKQPLARRPEHSGTLALVYTGIDRLRLEVSVTGVGERFDRPNAAGKLDPYARVDLKADYQLTPNVNLYGRVHNLFDTDYEAAAGYNTAGLSAYAGVRVKY